MAQEQIKEHQNEIDIIKVNGRIDLIQEKLEQTVETMKENANLLNGVILTQQNMQIANAKFDKDMKLVKKIILGFCGAISLALLQKFTGLFSIVL